MGGEAGEGGGAFTFCQRGMSSSVFQIACVIGQGALKFKKNVFQLLGMDIHYSFIPLFI